MPAATRVTPARAGGAPLVAGGMTASGPRRDGRRSAEDEVSSAAGVVMEGARHPGPLPPPGARAPAGPASDVPAAAPRPRHATAISVPLVAARAPRVAARARRVAARARRVAAPARRVAAPEQRVAAPAPAESRRHAAPGRPERHPPAPAGVAALPRRAHRRRPGESDRAVVVGVRVPGAAAPAEPPPVLVA